MEKGEIAHYEQFLLFPQCFQKMSIVDASEGDLWSKGLKSLSKKILGYDKFQMLFSGHNVTTIKYKRMSAISFRRPYRIYNLIVWEFIAQISDFDPLYLCVLLDPIPWRNHLTNTDEMDKKYNTTNLGFFSMVRIQQRFIGYSLQVFFFKVTQLWTVWRNGLAIGWFVTFKIGFRYLECLVFSDLENSGEEDKKKNLQRKTFDYITWAFAYRDGPHQTRLLKFLDIW